VHRRQVHPPRELVDHVAERDAVPVAAGDQAEAVALGLVDREDAVGAVDVDRDARLELGDRRRLDRAQAPSGTKAAVMRPHGTCLTSELTRSSTTWMWTRAVTTTTTAGTVCARCHRSEEWRTRVRQTELAIGASNESPAAIPPSGRRG